MRIAVVAWSNRKVGGTETYLRNIIPELVHSGYEVGFWHETDKPQNLERIISPGEVESRCVEELGRNKALTAMRDWKPDLIFSHGLHDLEFESATLKIAPAVFFAHDFYGTCISGAKMTKFPTPTPCNRQFSWKCLLHYYPHRCGGLNPLTMMKHYNSQASRLQLLRRYKVIVTSSTHMKNEYEKHGLAARVVSCPVTTSQEFNNVKHDDSTTWHLLFMGRMEYLKGGHVLLEALPHISRALNKSLRVTFAGDGFERATWENLANRVRAAEPRLQIDFVGWLKSEQLNNLLHDVDLLVVPSLWHEPFGLVGPEAGLRGIPAAAFAVGGIPDWLIDGVNGFLAPGDQPTAVGLASVVVKCLHDQKTHASLRQGARKIAQRFSMKNHIALLVNIFNDVAPVAFKPSQVNR